jgi:AraC-like DNA-binding protein
MGDRPMQTGPMRFSTRALPERARIAAWQEQFGRGMLRVDVEPLSDDPFNAEATLRSLPGLRTVSCATSITTRYDRAKELLADGDDSVGIMINLGRRAVVMHRGHEVALGPGEAIPMFTRAAAVLIATRHVGLLFPRSALTSRVRNLDAVPGTIPRETEALRLLVGYASMVRERFTLSTSSLQNAIVGHIHDLALLALGAQRAEDCRRAVAAARLNAALAFIKTNFNEPGLTGAEIARHQNISVRYLQRLIETTGKPLSAHLNELRLERACELLHDSDHQHRRISDIAMLSGFSDISYFNRQFRARFGDTPGNVRRGSHA